MTYLDNAINDFEQLADLMAYSENQINSVKKIIERDAADAESNGMKISEFVDLSITLAGV